MFSQPEVQMMLGLFATCAFALTGAQLKKYEQPWGAWILLGFATLCLSLAEYFRIALQNIGMHSALLTAGFALLGLVALKQFWDMMRLTR